MAAYEYETHEYDVVVVGAGGAGLRAAIAIGEENPDLTVGVISSQLAHPARFKGGPCAPPRLIRMAD